jgi:hypothetical protein
MAGAHKKDAESEEDSKCPSGQTLDQPEGCQANRDRNVNLIIENKY